MDATLLLAMIYVIIAFLVIGLFYFIIRHFQNKKIFQQDENLNNFVKQIKNNIEGNQLDSNLESNYTNLSRETSGPALNSDTPLSPTIKKLSTPNTQHNPLADIDALVALNKFPQAIGLLNKQIVQSPDLPDLHLKMLELAAASKDKELFEEHIDIVEKTGTPIQKQVSERLKKNLFGTETESAVSNPPLNSSKEKNELPEGDAFSFFTNDSSSSFKLDSPTEKEVRPEDTPTSSKDISEAATATDNEIEFDLSEFGLSDSQSLSSVATSPLEALSPSNVGKQVLSLDVENETPLEFKMDLLDEVSTLSTDSETAPPSGVASSNNNPVGFDLPDNDLDFEVSLEAPSVSGKIPASIEIADPSPLLSDIGLIADTTIATHDVQEPSSSGLEFIADSTLSSIKADNLSTDDLNDDAEISLELAQSYINYGERESAIDLLKDVLEIGSSLQKQKAQSLLKQIS